MEIRVEKSELVSLISKTQNVVEKRNTMPVLINILLEVNNDKLKVFATDLEVSLTDEINVDVVSEGKVAVDAKSFFNIIRELEDGTIELKKQENNWLEIIQGKSRFNIVGISSDEYPVFPTYSSKDFIKLNGSVLKDMIEKTIYSVSNDETRYHLNGVFFEQIPENSGVLHRMVATDGHRLSVVNRFIETEIGSNENSGVIIPRKGLNEIKKLLDSDPGVDVEMAVEGAQLIVKLGSTLLMIRLIEGKYPNYQQLIPKQLNKQVWASRTNLVTSLKRVSLLANQKSRGVTMKLKTNALEITSNSPEIGDAREEIEVDYSGEEMKIGFNAKYLLDILNSIEDEKVGIELNDQLSPGLIRPDHDKNYTCIVMPMRI